MHQQRQCFVLSAAALLATTLWAAEPATPPAPAGGTKAEAAKPDAAATSAADAAKPAAAGSEAAKIDPVKGAAKTAADTKADKDKAAEKGSPQRFIPSEQVRADFDVSFPIDI